MRVVGPQGAHVHPHDIMGGVVASTEVGEKTGGGGQQLPLNRAVVYDRIIPGFLLTFSWFVFIKHTLSVSCVTNMFFFIGRWLLILLMYCYDSWYFYNTFVTVPVVFFFLICLIAFIIEAVTSVTIVISVIGILLRDATPILRSYNICPYFLLVIT